MTATAVFYPADLHQFKMLCHGYATRTQRG